MIYTGIGSRQTPPEILAQMKAIAYMLAMDGHTLRSGGADGADTAFEEGCKSADGKMEIYLPWPGFNGRPKNGEGYIQNPDWRAHDIARKYHPVWDNLSYGTKNIMARNVHQVLGLDLNTPASMIIYWHPEDGEGGTGQALRVARALNIQQIRLGIMSTESALDVIMHSLDRDA